MKILTSTEISNLCDYLLRKSISENSEFRLHIELLYRYGLRVSEVVGVNLLHRLENGNLMVTMKKTGFTRIIQRDNFIDSLNLDNLNSINEFTRISEVNLSRYINKISYYRFLKVGSKRISTHIFRHNFAKKMFLQVENYAIVNEFLQEQNIEVCKGYVNSLIYY